LEIRYQQDVASLLRNSLDVPLKERYKTLRNVIKLGENNANDINTNISGSTNNNINFQQQQSTNVTRIHKLQKLAMRIVYDQPRLTSSGPLFKAAKVLPIQQRVKLRTAIMVFKARNQLVPEYICDLFQLKSSVTNRVTRSCPDNDLWVPRNKLAIRRKALPYSGATLYNSLPLEIRNSSSVASFKIRTYQYFLETV
jgi:hypothetical protein